MSKNPNHVTIKFPIVQSFSNYRQFEFAARTLSRFVGKEVQYKELKPMYDDDAGNEVIDYVAVFYIEETPEVIEIIQKDKKKGVE